MRGSRLYIKHCIDLVTQLAALCKVIVFQGFSSKSVISNY